MNASVLAASFTWPLALWSLLVVPALLLAYVVQLRRKRKAAVVFSNVGLLKAAMPTRAKWKRHIPIALFLLGLTGLGVASARPQASVQVPLGRTSIILALDVSRSMCATDVEPNRLTVAQTAALSFVKDQPVGTRIGLVAFAGIAQLVVAPTTDRGQLQDAINKLTTVRGTAIGAATLKSLDAIAAVNPEVKPIDSQITAGAELGSRFDQGFDPFGEQQPVTPEPKRTAPPNGYIPDIVVLLTDGANTRGIDPIEAAKQAVTRRVRVYTIGFGTENATEMACTPAQLGGEGLDDVLRNGFGPGAQGRMAARRILSIDEPTLRSVSNMTGGEFYKAQDAGQLRKVFADLPRQVTLQKRNSEISVAFVLAGVTLLLSAMFLSLRWNR